MRLGQIRPRLGARGPRGRRMEPCPIVQGVQFVVQDDGKPVRGLILSDVLQACFGADESPQSWLRAYVAHADVIGAAALLRHRRDPCRAFVLLGADPAADFGLDERHALPGPEAVR